MTDQYFQVFNGAITTILKLLTYQTLLLFFFIGIYARSIKTYNGLDLLNWQAGIMGKRVFHWCHFLLLIKRSYSRVYELRKVILY